MIPSDEDTEEPLDEWSCVGIPIKLRNNNDHYDIAKLTIKKILKNHLKHY